MSPARTRLPNRRPSHTEALAVAGQTFTATVGFDPGTCRPRELFLTGGKEGSLINAMLAAAAVVISVALQHSIPAQSLAKSVGRGHAGPRAPADLDEGKPARLSASPIGAALDLLRSLEHAPE